MNTKLFSLEEIQSALTYLRQDPDTKHKFPRELWDSIINLTKTIPFEEVCHLLHINPIYLKRKMLRLQKTSLEFHEVSIANPLQEIVMIELFGRAGLKAKIHGPVSCLNYLHQLFRR